MSNNEYNDSDLGTSKKEFFGGYDSLETQIHSDDAAKSNLGVVQSIGHVLCNARIARGMSVEEVAQQLRLSVQQVDAIEKEDFEKLPGQTFIRGFVRNYANLVELDPSTILPLLPQSATSVRVQRTPFQINEASFSSIRSGSGSKALSAMIGLGLLALLSYGIYQSGDWWKQLVGDEDKTTIVKTEQAGQEIVELQLPISSATSTSHLGESNANLAVLSPGLQTTPLPPIKNVYGTLHFLFTTEAWVEVKDGSGKTIFEQINNGGSERVVSGQRPLSLVVKNAAGVSLTYNDRPIDIKPYTRSEDGVASFTLE